MKINFSKKLFTILIKQKMCFSTATSFTYVLKVRGESLQKKIAVVVVNHHRAVILVVCYNSLCSNNWLFFYNSSIAQSS